MDQPPRQYSKVSFWACLIVGAFGTVDGFSRLFSPNIYQQQGWAGVLAVSAALFVAAYFLHRRNKAAAQALSEYENRRRTEEAQRLEADRMLREQRRAEQEAWEATHGTITTKIAGVTFDNDDGTSRQRVLQSALADECCGTITLEHYDHKGSDAILVIYDGHGVGNIPKNRVAEVLAVMDRITAGSLSVERFVPDDEDDEVREAGGVIYRADLTLVYSK
jgi:hypothetical protein